MRQLWSALTERGRWIGALAVVLLGSGVGLRYPGVAALGGALLVLVVAELVSVLVSGGIESERTVAPHVVVRHEPCEGTLVVRGHRRRGLLRLDIGDLVDGVLVPVHLPDTSVADVPVTSLGYPVPTPRRGLIDVGPVRVRRYGLTGMAARSTTSGDIDRVRVLPRRIPVSVIPAGRRSTASGNADSVELGGTDIVGLHEYSMGDDLRRVHWASSARTGSLMVREDAEPSEPHLLVLLDDRATSYPGESGAASFEEAVEITAALCRVAADVGHPVRFRTTSARHEVVVPGSHTRQPQREARELEWVLAEIDLSDTTQIGGLGTLDLDVVVAVSGAGVDEAGLTAALGGAASRVLTVVDPAPTVAVSQHGGVLTLRAASSTALAALWDGSVG